MTQQRQHVLQTILEQHHQRRAHQRAGQLAQAAGHGHQQVLDAGTDIERRRTDKAVHVRIQPARQTRQQGRHDEQAEADTERIGTDTRQQRGTAAQGTDGAPRAGLQNVVAEQAGQSDQRPDQVVNRARVCQRPRPQGQRRNIRQAAVPAQGLHVAEQQGDRQAPGNARQGQVVTTQTQRERANGKRRQAGQYLAGFTHIVVDVADLL